MELNEGTAQSEAQGDEGSVNWHRPRQDMGSGIPWPQAFCEKAVTCIAMLWLFLVSELEQAHVKCHYQTMEE